VPFIGLSSADPRFGAMELLRRLSPALHPILFAVYPVLALFALNQTEVQLKVLWVPLVLSVAAGAVLYGIFLLIFKSGPALCSSSSHRVGGPHLGSSAAGTGRSSCRARCGPLTRCRTRARTARSTGAPNA
jgi:hypothetical protein